MLAACRFAFASRAACSTARQNNGPTAYNVSEVTPNTNGGGMSPPDLIDLERRLRRHVEQIASCPRPPGSAAHLRVREYVREHLSRAGFGVQDDPFAGGPAPGVNLLTQPVGAAELPLVIVGAHYDSLP